jgi:hypothetical protein
LLAGPLTASEVERSAFLVIKLVPTKAEFLSYFLKEYLVPPFLLVGKEKNITCRLAGGRSRTHSTWGPLAFRRLLPWTIFMQGSSRRKTCLNKETMSIGTNTSSKVSTGW